MSRLIDADVLMPNAEYKGKHDVVTAYDIANAPTIDAVPKSMIFHVETFDEMHETYTEEELTLEELLDKYTDEGYPNALNALDALEEEE